MSRRALSWLVLAAGTLIGLLTPPQYFADVSTYLGMADSLVHDGDLRYAPEDLERLQAVQAERVPAGLLLIKRGGEYLYGKPLLYPLAAAPWFAALGVRGFMAFNGFLLAVLVLLGADILAHRLRWEVGLAVAAAAVAACVTQIYRLWIDPHLLLTCLIAGAVAAARRGRAALTAALLVLAAWHRFPYLALAAAPAALFGLDRQWRRLAVFAATGIAVGLALLVATRLAFGQWSPYTGDRVYFPQVAPYEHVDTEPAGVPSDKGRLLDEWRPPSAADLAVHLREFFLGRFAGVVLYYPAFFACLLWMRRLDREKAAWLVAFGLYVATVLLVTPHLLAGGAYTVGNRFFVLLPVAWVMVDFVGRRPLRLAASAALLALAVPVCQAPLHYSLHPGRQGIEAPYRWFPVEWTQVARLTLPFPFPGLSALTANQYDWEEGGVWTRGASTAEFVLVRRAGTPARVEVSSLLPSARIGDGDAVQEIPFEPFVPRQITLTHPRAILRDESGGFDELAVYDLTVDARGGVRPIDRGINRDRRLLGVFVRPLS